ncbi:hypothetical protein K450DRAFT_249804 [Umbelopsis ramanniana AG]|uniref:Zinc ribbon domain-containing protein n=1 Tax=Umbelopsis ramanniana AG TaxID=1314678 RepID=A0AAD5HBE4_UMBRA|nr:uncharacterized protein K450DRAFT_249804 [Umbelopsis ramanniana AG]KAI8577892.1 hypothetical protein K450DRAFT_249804 [Umbelopsis ramanniana AG]
MYPRRRMPIARTALVIGATSHVARNAARQENMAAENAYYRDQARQQEMNQQAQMQAQQQAQMQAQQAQQQALQAQQQAAATEEAVRRGIAQHEEQRRRAEQQNLPPPYQGQNYDQNYGSPHGQNYGPPSPQNYGPSPTGQNNNTQAVVTCDQCKKANQVSSSFCSNCGNKLVH